MFLRLEMLQAGMWLREATLANVETLERIFWRTTMIPEITFLQDRITHDAIPKLGFRGITASFDLEKIDVLTEQEEPRLKRETEYLDRGVLSVNEVRISRGLPPVAGGDDRDAPSRRRHPTRPTQPALTGAASRPYEQRTEERPSNGRLLSPAHPETRHHP